MNLIGKQGYTWIYCCLLWADFNLQQTYSFSINDRRSVINNLIGATCASTLIHPVVAIASVQTGIEGSGGVINRVEGIGGGFDLTKSMVARDTQVIFPASMEGDWQCERVVTSIEGDAGQAELAWRNLGGYGKTALNNIETFNVNFFVPNSDVKNEYLSVDKEIMKGVVSDEGVQMKSRSHDTYTVYWDKDTPDVLTYDNGSSQVEIRVVQRKIELPNEKGFGFDELYRVTSSAGGIFGENKLMRAIRVKRRYRRALDSDGNREVEGLEIMKTYRVLDGIAGELPTSTTKSQLKLTRKL